MIDFIHSIPPKFFVPILLLLIKFGFKQLIDRQFNAYYAAKGLLDFPIDIIFVSLSFLSAVMIINGWNKPNIFIAFLVILIVLLVSTVLWKRSIDTFDDEKWLQTSILAVVNFLLSTPVLIYTVFSLIGS